MLFTPSFVLLTHSTSLFEVDGRKKRRTNNNCQTATRVNRRLCRFIYGFIWLLFYACAFFALVLSLHFFFHINYKIFTHLPNTHTRHGKRRLQRSSLFMLRSLVRCQFNNRIRCRVRTSLSQRTLPMANSIFLRIRFHKRNRPNVIAWRVCIEWKGKEKQSRFAPSDMQIATATEWEEKAQQLAIRHDNRRCQPSAQSHIDDIGNTLRSWAALNKHLMKNDSGSFVSRFASTICSIDRPNLKRCCKRSQETNRDREKERERAKGTETPCEQCIPFRFIIETCLENKANTINIYDFNGLIWMIFFIDFQRPFSW